MGRFGVLGKKFFTKTTDNVTEDKLNTKINKFRRDLKRIKMIFEKRKQLENFLVKNQSY